MTLKADMARNKSSLPAGDDGHTIADMNVEGMPWYRKEPAQTPDTGSHEQMSKRQMRMYTMGAIRAGLLVVGVFSIALILFVLFCLKVWFR